MIPQHVVETLAWVAISCPALLLAVLGLPSLVRRPLAESVIGGLARATMLVAFVAIAAALVAYLVSGADPFAMSYGAWFSWGRGGFSIELYFDGMSLGFATLATAVSGIVAAFSHRYLHREPGYNRYFVLFAMFVIGILLVALAGSVEILIAGWELLGLSSALLVGFFHERPAPTANALRVFVVYRIGDAAMLAAAVLLHHSAGGGSLALLFGTQSATAALGGTQATVIALLLLTAVAAKSALLPLSGWLPRAMEGPTPSSAVYYGALSIHAGCFLLLRAEPLLEQAPVARVAIALAGLSTALYATFAARVQSDIKSALAYASLTQVGIIVVEIAFGLHTVAFAHMVGHALYRLLQFLSAPNVLHDLHELENATGGMVGPAGGRVFRRIPPRWQGPLFLFALERGFLDALLDQFVVGPFTWVVARLDRFDRAVCDLVAPRSGDDRND